MKVIDFLQKQNFFKFQGKLNTKHTHIDTEIGDRRILVLI